MKRVYAITDTSLINIVHIGYMTMEIYFTLYYTCFVEVFSISVCNPLIKPSATLHLGEHFKLF